MNNDLISRSELRKKLQARYDNGEEDFDKGYNIGVASAIELLDNAPSVEYTFEEAFQKTVCEQRLYCPERPQGDLIKAFELLKAHCKNRECNKDCVFYRELRVGDNTEQFCGLCEIVMNDDKEKEE